MSNKATVSTKGHLIDPHCKYITGAILEYNNSVYDCTLNQTDISSNKNKFYIMQIIKNGSKYILYIRFGRIGIIGNISHKEFTSEYPAVAFFEKQFKSKTGNSWHDRENFEKKDGKYFLTEKECADVSDETVSDSDESSDEEEKLDDRVIDFVKLITNTTYMKNTLVQLEIDTDKMPLGKIRQEQIDDAYEILDKINKNLKNQDKLVKLSSEFYTLIPIACGRQKPPVINNAKLIGKNINLLNELSQMVYGTKAVIKLKKDKGSLSKLYEDLHTDIIPLDKTDEMYNILVEYLINSRAPTHHFKFSVLNIYEINREFERDLYDVFSKKISNKTLLFHGTRAPNLCAILKNGLVVDPSKLGINVCITGKMFGLGLYFTNSCSKSIQYCAYDASDGIACLFVAEVALGNQWQKKQADPSITAQNLSKQYNSVWGMGRSTIANYDEYDDDTRIPHGKIKPIANSQGHSLLYDEFIVYHEEQVNLRYIIMLKVTDD